MAGDQQGFPSACAPRQQTDVSAGSASSAWRMTLAEGVAAASGLLDTQADIETALEALSTACYYLSTEKNRYRFSLSPNLNKLLADRRASVQSPRVEERIRAEVQKVFTEGKGVIDRIFFRTKAVRSSTWHTRH
jgi:hypothetical protein